MYIGMMLALCCFDRGKKHRINSIPMLEMIVLTVFIQPLFNREYL